MATTGNEIEPFAAEYHVRNEEVSLNALLLMLIEHVQRVKIPKVPKRLRLDEDDAYEPKIISFGPYHRGKDGLKDMEEHKERYLQAFLKRCPCLRDELKNKIKELEGDVRRCYSKDIDKGLLEENGEFLNMMMLDGCFIVEYLLRRREYMAWDKDDQLWRMLGVHTLLERDMLLLENQVPFFLLWYIFSHVKEQAPQPKQAPQQEPSQKEFMDLCYEIMFKSELPKPVHLLHFYHSMFHVKNTGTKAKLGRICDAINKIAAPVKGKLRSIINAAHTDTKTEKRDEEVSLIPSATLLSATVLPDKEKEVRPEKEKEVPLTIPSATVLHGHGITFKTNEAKESSIIDIDIKFVNGVLEIPRLVIDDSTESLFRNLIAFEQLHPTKDPDLNRNFSIYATFMDNLLNAPEDVALLCQKRILEHLLGRDEDVAHLFNNLAKGIFTDHPYHYLREQYKGVDDYRKRCWPSCRAILCQKYFYSPWAIVSVVAAIFLFIFAIVQLIFSAISTF